jgi:hypothetical protein
MPCASPEVNPLLGPPSLRIVRCVLRGRRPRPESEMRSDGRRWPVGLAAREASGPGVALGASGPGRVLERAACSFRQSVARGPVGGHVEPTCRRRQRAI